MDFFAAILSPVKMIKIVARNNRNVSVSESGGELNHWREEKKKDDEFFGIP